MADYDLYSSVKPVLGTAAAVTLDGATATPAIDTLGWQSLTFLLYSATAVAGSAVTFALTESDDNSTFTAVAAADVLFRATASSKVHTVGYRGKKRYVKAAATVTGTPAGQITAVLGHPVSSPFDQASMES